MSLMEQHPWTTVGIEYRKGATTSIPTNLEAEFLLKAKWMFALKVNLDKDI